MTDLPRNRWTVVPGHCPAWTDDWGIPVAWVQGDRCEQEADEALVQLIRDGDVLAEARQLAAMFLAAPVGSGDVHLTSLIDLLTDTGDD